MSFRTGDLVGDRYELGGQLGAGGMSRVYLAHDRLLDREVAVKVLSEQYASDPNFVERFRREASAAAGLNHPNIVAVYDRGEADGSYYIVMEYLPGPDLKQVIRRRAPLGPVEAIDNAVQILSALGAAHRRDVIHRDVKPQNVMVSEDGPLKVTDFGIARAGAQSEMTEAGSVIGTAQYLSPEQARGDDVTAASDCYSVGIVLYEMLTGRVPFDAERPVAVAMKQISDPPLPPRDLVPSIPPALEAVVLHSLGKRPSERYRTAEEFSRALLDVRAQLEGATGSTRMMAAAAGPPTEATSVLAAAPATEATRVAPARRHAPPPAEEPPAGRRWWLWALGAVLALVVVVGGAFALLGGGDDPVTVPNVVGQPVAAATATLKELGLQVTTRDQEDPDREPGTVVRSNPRAGETVAAGGEVTLFVSTGPGQTTVPDVVGLTRTAAQLMLSQEGFEVSVEERADDEAPAGQVISQTPAGNAQAPTNSEVTIVVSTGPDQVVVPNLSGMTQERATQVLADADLTIGRVSTRESTATPGTVIEQSPGASERVDPETAVNIVLAEEPEPETISVPNVVGNFAADAEAKLRGAGFEVRRQEANSDRPAGEVIGQTPQSGEVPRGSTITITISLGPAQTPDPPPDPTTTATVPQDPTTTAPTTPATGGAQVPPPDLP